MKSSLLSVVATMLMATACAAANLAVPTAASSADPQAAVRTAAAPTHLVALLPMHDGYGPADQDAYERVVAPIAADHGMRRDAAFTVTQFLGGAGPKDATTVGVWSLGAPNTLQDVMTDPRYRANMALRDRLHDMANVAMYVTSADVTMPAPVPGHALLVGVLAMKPGYGYDDHVAYEKSISAVTERHGMRLFRSYRVLESMGAGIKNAVAVAIWDLNSPEALGQVMGDPEYVENVPNRDRMHDMPSTTLYLVTPRAPQ